MRQSLRITVLLLAAGLVVLAAGCGGSKNAATTTNSGPTGSPTEQRCSVFANLADDVAIAMSNADNGNADPSSETASSDLQTVADAAPASIKSDAKTVASAFAGYVKAVQDSGYEFGQLAQPTAAQVTAFEKGLKGFRTAAFTQAEQHLHAWANENCK